MERHTINPWAIVRLTLRQRSVSLTAIAGLLAQAARPLISLLTLPILLSRLGEVGLGVWMIALSLMGLIGFVSAGLSASVITAIGRASSEPSGTELQRLVTSAAMISIAWGAVLLIVLCPFASSLDWATLLNLGDERMGEEVSSLMTVLVIMLSFGLVANVPRQIMVGRMHGYIAHGVDFLGVVLGAASLIVALCFHAPLWLLGLAFIGPSILTLFVSGLIYLHFATIPFLSLANFEWPTFKALSRESFRMAGYQGAYAISSQSDLILIGMVLGAPASVAYGVAQRVFAFPILLSATVNYAQWPAMAKADAGGDNALVGKMFRRTLLFNSGAAFVAASAVALAYDPLIKFWLGTAVDTDSLILLGMVCWVLIATMANTCDSLLRARQQTRFLMTSMVWMAVLNITITLALLPLIGPSGAIWGTVTGLFFALLVPYSVQLRDVMGTERVENEIENGN